MSTEDKQKQPSAPPSKPQENQAPSTREVYRLTPSEIASLRAESEAARACAREQLRIDRTLKHLDPAGGGRVKS